MDVGEHFRKFNRPETRAGADIERSLKFVTFQRSFEEAVTNRQGPGFVGDVLLVIMELVVRAPVSAIAVRVVSAAILPAVIGDGGIEGVGHGEGGRSAIIKCGVDDGRLSLGDF